MSKTLHKFCEALGLFLYEYLIVVLSDAILWTHREMEGMEIYFLTNQSGKDIEVNPSFRIEGLKPQLWDAVTGEVREISKYSIVDGRTTIPLKMEVDRSWFVIFSNDSNAFVKKVSNTNTPDYQVVQTLGSSWKIDFENKSIAPESITTTTLMDWSKSEDDLLKYYSGKANYTTTFNYQKTTTIAAIYG